MASSPRLSPSKRALLIEPQALFSPYFVDRLEAFGLDVTSVCKKPTQRELRRLAPGVVLVDAAHLTTTPFLTIRALRRSLPDAHIVVFTRANDAAWVTLARSFGADAIVGPRAEERDLRDALAA